MSSSHNEVVIVGAGLAGLGCALHLKKMGIPFTILEAADAVGGRIRTDIVDGFRLDRGFQVFLTAYPEARRVLRYNRLQLKSFQPGALVRYQGRFHRVSDPMRDPAHVLDTIASPIGTLADKMKVAKLRLAVATGATTSGSSGGSLSNGGEAAAKGNTTLQTLKTKGFSDAIIDRFFKPFFGGVFLERELSTSSRNFEFLFRMFSSGDTVLPANGMEEIPKQLAQQVGHENIRLNTRVLAVAENEVVLETGDRIEASHIVIATEGKVVSEMLYDITAPERDNAVTCLYFAADGAPPVSEPILVLNGDREGIINNLCVPSVVSSAYAPEGKSLISVTVLGNPAVDDATLEQRVRAELEKWYGADEVRAWNHLRTYRINNALPQQPADTGSRPITYEVRRGLYVCGDHMSMSSINGALESGRRVANQISTKARQSARAADSERC